MKKGIVGLTSALVLFSALFLSACNKSGPKTVNIKVDMADFTFTPAEVTVPAGAQVNLTLTNNGTLQHEWVILKLGEQATIPFNEDDEPKVYWEHEEDSGKSEILTFTAPSEAGEYQIVCGTAGHLEAGMQGKLIVTK
jgi:plastocyanin